MRLQEFGKEGELLPGYRTVVVDHPSRHHPHMGAGRVTVIAGRSKHLAFATEERVSVIIQSSLAGKPTGSDVRTCRRRSYRARLQYALDRRIKKKLIACEPEDKQKMSSDEQASISLICSGLVPQSQASTTPS